MGSFTTETVIAQLKQNKLRWSSLKVTLPKCLDLFMRCDDKTKGLNVTRLSKSIFAGGGTAPRGG